MKKRFNNASKLKTLLVALALLICNRGQAQFYSAKVDVLGLATGTLNVEGSMAISARWSLHLPVQYNPWTLWDNKKLKNLTVLPGIRYWQRETYQGGFFFGANTIISRYNIGGLFGSPYRYEGMGYGMGFSAGYSIPVKRQWNIEFELGAGALWSKRDKYSCIRCGEKIGKESGLWMVPDKAAVSIVYLF